MKKKQPYSAVSVDKFDVRPLLPALAGGCILAIDVAKEKFVVALSTLAGEVVRTVRFRHPLETELFLNLVATLLTAFPAQVIAAMEPTGTYGDAVRHQLRKLGVPVKLVSAKRVHDTRELFDGVPSSHDGKSAFLVAKLHSEGLSRDWPERSDWVRAIRALVDQRQVYGEPLTRCLCRLEALVMRHWPELPLFLDMMQQKCALRLLARYGSPANVAADPGAAAFLRKSANGNLAAAIVQGTIDTASLTTGLPAVQEEVETIRCTAGQALEYWGLMDAVELRISELGKDVPLYQHLRGLLGPFSAAAFIAYTNPMDYESPAKLEKACGLNLRENSSGEHQGRLHITRRGPPLVRRLLYLASLRLVRADAHIRAWYQKRRGYTEETKKRAVVAVMRKLVKAAWHVARGAKFEPQRLVDVRRLDVATPAPQPDAESLHRGRPLRRELPRTTTTGKWSRRTKGGAATATP